MRLNRCRENRRYLCLLESYWAGGGKVRHRVLTYLGRVENKESKRLKGRWVKMKQAEVILNELEDESGGPMRKPMFAKFHRRLI